MRGEANVRRLAHGEFSARSEKTQTSAPPPRDVDFLAADHRRP
jgi:hypothetical protein